MVAPAAAGSAALDAAPAPSGALMCDHVAATNRQLIEAAVALADEQDADPKRAGGFGRVPPPNESDCVATGPRAWAKRYRSVALAPRAFQWELVFLDGAELVLGEPVSEEQEFSVTSQLSSFDLDNDGVPEAWFTVSWEGPEGGSGQELFVYTAKSGRLSRLALPGVTALEDVDGDGRPDALIQRRETIRLDCGGYAYDALEAPSQILHSLPDGTFSATDAAAQAHARKACVEQPKQLIVFGQKAGKRVINERASAHNLVCARLWGAEADDLRRLLTSACSTPRFHQDCESFELGPGECAFRDLVLGWIETARVVFPSP